MTSASTNLTGYAEQVAYELGELVTYGCWLVDSRPLAEADRTIRNALLEADLVHARCLLEFLLNRDNQKESIVAFHFAPKWKAPNEDVLRVEHKRICDHLSHLSKERVKVKAEWDVVGIIGAILDALEDLVRRLGAGPHGEALRQGSLAARTSHASMVKALQAPSGALVVPQTTTAAASSVHMITGSTGPPPAFDQWSAKPSTER